VAGSGITFYGVRGSTPFSASTHTGFGGNTCCAVIDIPDEKPIILDMGSGLFAYARELDGCALEASVLLTHLHWDHVAGLPFFSPVLCPGGKLDIYGPPDEGMSLGEAINSLIKPPFFPVTVDDFAGELNFHDLWSDDLELSTAKVWARSVPHTSATSGYRVELEGKTIVYIPDHQQPLDDPTQVAPSVLELCDGADLLIHDGQYPQALRSRSLAKPAWPVWLCSPTTRSTPTSSLKRSNSTPRTWATRRACMYLAPARACASH